MVRPPDPRLIAARFQSRLRSPRLASQLGLVLAVMFGTCMITGYLSHAIAAPPWWFHWPARPVNLYRFTQGLHVATGLATIPILGAKLWTVYPRLFTWPPVRDARHALEHQGARGASPAIEVRTELAGDRIRLAVSDNGAGFPEELMARIFEPYVTTKPRGTGLGLAIVKKIVDEHHGAVTIENQPSRGASVSVLLPLAKAA